MCKQSKPQAVCEECEYKTPDLNPENDEAWELYKSANTQWRSSGFGVIGYDFVAVYQIADVLGIEKTPVLHEKMRILESLMLNKINNKGEAKYE